VTLGDGADVFVISTNLGTTTFVDYANGTDTINLQSIAALTYAKADGDGVTAGTQVIAYGTSGGTAVAVGGSSQGNLAFVKLGTATTGDDAAEIDSSFAVGGSFEVLGNTDSAVIIFAGADASGTVNVFKAVYGANNGTPDGGSNTTVVTKIGVIVLNTGDIDDLAASGLFA
jgi:hypothetical protein